MKSLLVGIILTATGIWIFNAGIEVGIRNKPVFDSGKYQEVGCNDIVASEYGLRCEVVMNYEDDNIRIFKGEGALDD